MAGVQALDRGTHDRETTDPGMACEKQASRQRGIRADRLPFAALGADFASGTKMACLLRVRSRGRLVVLLVVHPTPEGVGRDAEQSSRLADSDAFREIELGLCEVHGL